MASIVKSIPNFLTYLRLFLVPVLVALLIDPTPESVHWAAFFFIIASVTDFFDGFIARRLKAVSDTGKLLDPLADKILVMAALVMLVGQRADIDGAPWVPAWMVVIILARELWITGLRGIAATRGTVIAAGTGGKWKSALQIVAISCLLLHYPIRINDFVFNLEIIGVNILIVSIGFSLWSAGEYTTAVLGKAALVKTD